MRPEICENCCASEFIEQDDAYVCAYCSSRFRKAPVKVVKEIQYVQIPVGVPGREPVRQEPAGQEIPAGRPKNKWIAFFLCLFLGVYGAHKFYEGRIGMGILYLFTGGLFVFGWIADCIRLLTRPNPYYVK